MAKGLNAVTLIGNLGKDIELRYTASGAAVGNFSLAIGSSKKVGDNWEDFTEWVNCVVFGKTAENCANYLSKGSQAAVVGRIQTSKWDDKDGKKQYMTEIVADNIIFLEPKDDSQGYHKPQEPPGGVEIDLKDNEKDDDIPF